MSNIEDVFKTTLGEIVTDIMKIISTNDHGDEKSALLIRSAFKASIIQMLTTTTVKFDMNKRDRENNTLLIHAVKDNAPPLIFECLIDLEDLDVNAQDSNGDTALICAARCGNITAVKILSGSRKTNVNISDKSEKTALDIAISEKHAGIVEILLHRDDIIVKNESLIEASSFIGNVEVTRALLESPKVNVNFQDKEFMHNSTALMLATNDEILNMILNHEEIDVNAKDINGKTALFYISKLSIVEKILKFNNVIITKNLIYEKILEIKKIPPYQRTNQINVLEKLICHNNCPKDLYIPEIFVNLVKFGNKNIVKSFLDKQEIIDVNETDENEDSSLIIAVREGYRDIVEILLCNNIMVNMKNKLGLTALMFSRWTDITEMLLKHPDINVNLVDNNLCTALHHLANQNYPIENLKLLLNHKGIDPNRRNIAGDTPLAMISSYTERSFCEYNEFVDVFLACKDVDVNAKNKKGLTPLMQAVEIRNNMPSVKSLLRNEKTVVNAQNDDGDTAALLVAKRYGDIDILRVLMPETDIHIRNKKGQCLSDIIGEEKVKQISDDGSRCVIA